MLKEIEPHRDTYFAAGSVFGALIICEQFQLLSVDIQRIIGCFFGYGALAAVSADELAPAREGVHSQAAVIGAKSAVDVLYGVRKAAEFLCGEHCALFKLVLHRIESRAVSAHQARDNRSNSFYFHFLLKGAQNSVIQKCSALNNDISAKFLGGTRSYYLIYSVFNYAYRKSRRDVFDGSAIFLRLFYRGIHKNGAAAAEVNRAVSKKTKLGEFLNVFAQRVCEGLQKRAAAGVA